MSKALGLEPAPGEPPPEFPEGITESQAGGKFAFRGTAERDDLRLRATCEGRVSSSLVAFASGAADVTIVLDRAGSMEGKILHEPRIGPLLQLTLRRSNAAEASPVHANLFFDWGGSGTVKPDVSRFECGSLVPGE